METIKPRSEELTNSSEVIFNDLNKTPGEECNLESGIIVKKQLQNSLNNMADANSMETNENKNNAYTASEGTKCTSPVSLKSLRDEDSINYNGKRKNNERRDAANITPFCMSEKEENQTKGFEIRQKKIYVNILLDVFSQMEKQKELESKTQNSHCPEDMMDKSCANKYCLNTDSKDLNCERKKVKEKIYCIQCADALMLDQYCEYCMQIYTDKSDKGALCDGLDWVECDSCSRWTHVLCESRNRDRQIEDRMLDPFFKYYCSNCQETAKSKKTNSNSKLNLKKINKK